MATKAQVVIRLHQQLASYRAVGSVAHRASFPHRFVFEDEGTGLFAMAFAAGFVLARHGQTARRLENISTMGIVTLDAIDAPFGDRMVIGQVELRMRLEMA